MINQIILITHGNAAISRVEKDLTKWYKSTLTEKFKELPLCENDASIAMAKEIKKFEGEVTYCNRKRKHMFFYDLNIHISWEAKVEDKTIKGEIRVPSLCEDVPISSTKVSSPSNFLLYASGFIFTF
jgi:activator of HSP90 ATPase